MRKLPEIYKCNIDKQINNNKEYCYLENIKENNINQELNNLFNSLGPIYNKKVLIRTPLREIETYIYKKNNNYIITKELERINIKDIISIKRIM